MSDLVAKGLVQERIGMNDRRERYLHLTEEGLHLEEQITNALGKRLYKRLPPAALKDLRTAMRILLGTEAKAEG